MTEAWHDRQVAAHARVEAIKAEQAGRIVDGNDFDVEELIEAEAALQLLYSAEGEEQRRTAALHAGDVERRRQEIKQDIKELIEQLGEQVETAETACGVLADALREILALNDTISKKMRQIGLYPSAAISRNEALTHISYRMCQKLGPAIRIPGQSGGSGKLGAITVRSVDGHVLPDGTNPAHTWREAYIKRANFKHSLRGKAS